MHVVTRAATQGNWLVGLLAVTGACVSSGFAGVFFEKILKGGSSIWVRNIQLALLGLLISAASLAWDVRAGTLEIRHFFHGYNWCCAAARARGADVPRLTVWVVAVNALGGLLVATVVKYADNILKGTAVLLPCRPTRAQASLPPSLLS